MADSNNNEDKLKYFRIAKELNKKYHEYIVSKELHFRGNINSFSLVSVSMEFSETGKSGLKTKESGEKILKSIILKKPERPTPEKNLQAWIIKFALMNNLRLPFGNYTLITSELAFPTDDRKKGYVNDILALDDENTLVIIELKSIRTNQVKKQAIEFEEKIVNKNKDFFFNLVSLILDKKWNGKTRKISVWPKTSGEPQNKKYEEVEELSYFQEGYNYSFL